MFAKHRTDVTGGFIDLDPWSLLQSVHPLHPEVAQRCQLNTSGKAAVIGGSMAHYIDGFVHPIRRDRLESYRRLAQSAAEVWKEHGALDYVEHVGDDMTLEGTRPFPSLIGAKEDEVIVFGWVAFASREARDLANKKVAADPRMTELMESSDSGFDASRMAYGGFRPLVGPPDGSAG